MRALCELKDFLLIGLVIGGLTNFWLTNIYDFLLLPLLQRIFYVIVYPCISFITVWLFFPKKRNVKKSRKARPIFLGISSVSVAFSISNLVIYYSTKASIGLSETDVFIKGIPVVKILWSLFLAGVFGVAERFIALADVD